MVYPHVTFVWNIADVKKIMKSGDFCKMDFIVFPDDLHLRFDLIKVSEERSCFIC